MREARTGKVNAGTLVVVALAGVAAGGVAAFLALRRGHAPTTHPVSPPIAGGDESGGGGATAEKPSLMVEKTTKEPPGALFTCSVCHAIPPPEALTRDRWPHMLQRMNAMITQYTLGAPLPEDELRRVIDYYTANAPAYFPTAPTVYAPSEVKWDVAALGAPGMAPGTAPGTAPGSASATAGAEPPFIAGVRLVDMDGDGRPEVLVCDTRASAITLAVREGEGWKEKVLGAAPFPAVARVADMNGDGAQDVVVAALGGVAPTDEPLGSVVVFTASASGAGAPTYAARTVLSGVARGADVFPADFNGDGRMDLAVALFGLFKTGEVAWLEQRADGAFEKRTLLQITGASHVPVADFDGDGRPDIAALVSQQHEKVFLFRNTGAGAFEMREVFKAAHPVWGFSSLMAIDLDKDGDADLVATNGDALDADPRPKPYHGVAWLENDGKGAFTWREIAKFYGAYTAAGADFDGDGDTDLAIGSMMNIWDDPARQSVIWLENDGKQGFTAHAVTNTPTWVVTLAAGDVDGDGRPDVVAGCMNVMPPLVRTGRMALMRNLGARAE